MKCRNLIRQGVIKLISNEEGLRFGISAFRVGPDGFWQATLRLPDEIIRPGLWNLDCQRESGIFFKKRY
ncbi:unnamed protein product [Rhizophagus irregularis]|nr:unnamed protein product [Rhizophagus irregularis]